MKARTFAALAVLCGCHGEGSIHRERITHEAAADLTGMSTDVRGRFERPKIAHLCELGARRGCFGGHGPHLPGANGGPGITLWERCVTFPDGIQRWSNADCDTPLVVAFDGSPIAFTRPDADFTIVTGARTEWISAKTPWLALDRDGSGCIDNARELFAGFDALAELDANGDGVIDARDPAFSELVLWSDRNQDKRCTPEEVTPISFARLPLSYVTKESSGYGSYEGETAMLAGGARLVDVHLAVMP